MPQDLDDNDLVSTSSDETNQDVDVAAASGSQVDGERSDPSTEQDVSEDRGALDVVEDVVKARQAEEGSSPEAKKDGEPADPKADQEKQDREIDNDPSLPEKTRKRIRTLLDKEKAARREAEGYKADAERYQGLTRQLQAHGVPAEEARDALMVACLSRTDPRRAWEIARPFVQQLLIAAGEVLPQDLKERVEKGELTVDAANELAREQAKSRSLETQREINQRQQEEREHNALVTSLKKTASDWQADREAKDPNFEAKKLAIFKELKWLQSQEEEARTPEAVRDQLERAYKAVNAEFVLNRAATRPNTPTVGDATRRPAKPASTSSTRQPANGAGLSTLDIIRRQVAARGAAA